LRTSENELARDDIGKFLNLLNDNIPHSQNVIDRMLVYYKNNFFTQINNYNNFNHFAGLLNTILFNIDRKIEYFDINFAIIYIAEKTFYKNKDNSYNKIYLSSLLSKNKIFNERKFWVDLIELKLNSVVENKLPTEIRKKENELIDIQNKLKQQQSIQNELNVEEEKNNFNSNVNQEKINKNSNSIISTENNTFYNINSNDNNINNNSSSPREKRKNSNSLMNMFGNKVKNFFSASGNSGINSNTNSEMNKSLSYSLNTDARKIDKLNDTMGINKDQIIESLKKRESAIIMKQFLTHFCNYNFDVAEANDLIIEFSLKYKYKQEKINLFISMLNSNMFTIKNKSNKISLIDYKRSGSEKNFKKYLNLNDNKLIILASSLKYTSLTDYPNIMLINKNYNKKISKIIFSNVLLNYHNTQINNSLQKSEYQKNIRLGIWKKALNIVLI